MARLAERPWKARKPASAKVIAATMRWRLAMVPPLLGGLLRAARTHSRCGLGVVPGSLRLARDQVVLDDRDSRRIVNGYAAAIVSGGDYALQCPICGAIARLALS